MLYGIGLPWSAYLAKAIRVMEHWGFEYKSNVAWVKDKIGLGWYVRNQHELLLIGRRGKLPIPDPNVRPSSVVWLPREKAHSKKPESFHEMIERMYPGYPKIELFARAARPGWDAWGNQLASEMTLGSPEVPK